MGLNCRRKTENPKYPCKSTGLGGEGGIRTHGTVTRTTVFDRYGPPLDVEDLAPLDLADAISANNMLASAKVMPLYRDTGADKTFAHADAQGAQNAGVVALNKPVLHQEIEGPSRFLGRCAISSAPAVAIQSR